jgi:hypothetical protein
MDTATPRASAPWRAVFADTLGKRYHGSGPVGEPLEAFELRAEFGANAAFETALRQRMTALAGFHNASFPRVRQVQRAEQPEPTLLAISERLPGTRLSTILAVARQRRLTLNAGAALCVVRQLLPAIAILHEKQPATVHGAIGPERIVITAEGRVAVVDHMLGSALEALQYAPDRYWKELHLPVSVAAPVVFDQRADVIQIGVVTLALLLGRPIEPHEWPERIAALAKQACESTAVGPEAFRTELHIWLRRMLHLPEEKAFASAGEAWAGIERVLDSSQHIASFDALASFMTEYAQSALDSHVTVNVAATTGPLVAAIPNQQDRGPLPTLAVAAKIVPTEAPPRLSDAAATLAATSASRPASPPAAPAPSLEATSHSTDTHPLPQSAVPPERVIAESPKETVASGPLANRSTGARLQRHWRWAAGVVLALASAALLGLPSRGLTPAAGADAVGTLVVNTDPAGAPVIVDGTARGVTPLTLELAPGPHELLIVGTDGEPRVIPLNIAAGSTVAQTIELSNKAAARTGELMIRSDPPGARITIDGAPIGITPFMIDGLTPGTHTVTLTSEAGTASQDVVIEAGMSASLLVPLSPAQGVPVSGWISVSAPVEVQVFEEGRLLGTSRSDRIMVSAGRHVFEIVNEALSYRATQSVVVSPGKVAAMAPDWPKASLALNAAPWAEVWINGESVGETPIGKLLVPIGWHQIVFRHPQLGEQTVRATVTGGAPARVSVDMSKRQ